MCRCRIALQASIAGGLGGCSPSSGEREGRSPLASRKRESTIFILKSLKRKNQIDAMTPLYYHAGIMIFAKARHTMDEERCWQAVLAREAGFDGAFVYAVRSTGIFCRPSCPSRRPRREQAVFFGQPSAAEQAGL